MFGFVIPVDAPSKTKTEGFTCDTQVNLLKIKTLAPSEPLQKILQLVSPRQKKINGV